MQRSRAVRILLILLLGALALMMLLPAGLTHAESPSPSVTAAVTTPPPTPTSPPSPTATATPAAPSATPVGETPYESNYQPPCPNPTATPGPSPTPTPSLQPGQTATPTPVPSPTRHPNLCPATFNSANPLDILAVLFTPIFQTIFIVLAFVYNVTGDIGIAIIVVTLAIRLLLVPLFRRQIVSQRRLQALQPELSEIRRRFKGDRNKQSQEQMKLYSERGINPAAGCLPSVMQLFLLLPMYYVFTAGLNAPDISSMLTVFGVTVVNVTCQAPGNALVPCINPTLHWLGGLNASQPAVLFHILGFGVSIIAIISALLQLVQSRMMMPPATDSQARAQQQAFMIVPLISIVYGSFLPAGLFIYWIVTTVFSIVQQYLTVGWGSLFPLFGWTPGFAVDHTPRFGVPNPPVVRASTTTPPASSRAPSDAAAGTVRPAKSRGRTSRRGRRR
ncbi:MAG: YidC/Oxa1 family membrane protein insertase [Candidatus Limnocylindrales bacterium]